MDTPAPTPALEADQPETPSPPADQPKTPALSADQPEMQANAVALTHATLQASKMLIQTAPANSGSCAGTENWTSEDAAREDEMLRLVNVARSAPRNCGSQGSFPAASPLSFDIQARCAARRHAKDMADKQYFDHASQSSGLTFGQRMQAAGYTNRPVSENIAAGEATAEKTNSGLMGSDGHCANIMSKDATQLAVGAYTARGQSRYSTYWVQNFGTNRN